MATRKTCIFHEKDLLPLFCKKCELLVCPECVENDHNQHEFVGVSSIVETHKQFLRTYLEKETKDFKCLENRVDKALSELCEHSESVRSEIKTEKRKLIKELDVWEAELFEKITLLELKHGSTFRAMKARLANIQNIPGQSEQMPDMQASLIDELRDVEIVALKEDLKGVLSANEKSYDLHSIPFRFYKAEKEGDGMWKLGSVIEEMESTSDSGELVDETSTDTNDGDDVFHDCAGSPEVLTGMQIFKSGMSNVISRSNDSTLILHGTKLFDTNIPKTQETDLRPILNNVFQVERNNLGEIYILMRKNSSTKCTFQAAEVFKMKPDGRIVTVCDLGQVYGCCLGFTTSGGTVALLTHKKTEWTYQRQKLEININGIITNSSDRVDFGIYPDGHTCHCCTRVIVLSDGRSVALFSKKVIVFDSSLKKTLTTYYGIQGNNPSDRFQVEDMCLDIYGNILIADKGNNAVHVLDTNLKFIKFLVKEEDGVFAPVSLSFDNQGSLWIGCYDGKVFVVNYKTLYFSSK